MAVAFPNAAHATTQGPAVHPDSADVLRAAQRAQRRFERTRRQLLPWALASGRGGCDVTVGRICFWFDEDPTITPTPESANIVSARTELITALDSAARLLPGDDWIAGQRVRYLTEDRRLLDARWAIEGCAATPWWCAALAGFVLHVQGSFADADSAFARALAQMPAPQRCEWDDLAQLLEGDVRRYVAADCDTRATLNRRIWLLADPLYLTPGNERRTEHFARLVMVRLFETSENTYGMRWGRDNRELLMRYGWATWFERDRPFSSLVSEGVNVIGHHRRGTRRFLPAGGFLSDSAPLDAGDWELNPGRPRSHFAPAYATEFEALDHQLALFRRGDSAVVVAAFDLVAPTDPRVRPWTASGRRRHRSQWNPAQLPVDVALAFVPDTGFGPALVHGIVVEPVARTAISVPAVPGLVSVEVLAGRDSSAARARYRIDPGERFREPFSLSDLLVIEGSDRRPRDLEEAARLARGTTRLEPGEPVHLYWEMPVELGPDAPAVALTVVREDKGFLRRAVEFLGFAGSDSTAARLEWDDLPPAARTGPGRSVAIRIPDDEGRYVIRLEVTSRDRRTTAAEREIEVRKP